MSGGERAAVDAYLGVGANLGDRARTIEGAIADLDAAPGVRVVAASRLHRTAAVGPVAQPDFLNGAIAVSTTLSARDLLSLCLDLERAAGRDREAGPRWGPRPLDLDLLLYGREVIDEPDLRVPHPRMHQRAFVLVPLAEIAPRAHHPGLDQPIESVRAALCEQAARPS